MSELDAIRFVEGQQFHRSTVDQLDLRELDGDDAAFRERGAKDFQVFPCNPPTDAENDTLFNRKPVDSAGHRAGCRHSLSGKPHATRNSQERAAKPDVSVDGELVNLKNLVDVVNLVILAGFSET